MLSIEIIEILQIGIVVLVAIFSAFALFFSAKRQARKFQYKLWNVKTKRYFWIFLIAIIAGLFVLNLVANSGNIILLAPTFLIYYGVFLVLLNSKKKRNLYLISGISFLLAPLVYVIPTYWYSAILIIGASHIVYGLMNRK
ncbi:MAG: hypothetical protein JXR05_06315 [Flavobacteriaceae bacterium]